jgi:HSP20 family protein
MFLTQPSRLGWDPFAEIRRMQTEMGRLFADVEARSASQSFPPINIWVGVESLVVTAEIPGVAPANLDITVREDTLTMQGYRAMPVETDGVAWHRRERPYGSFSRTVALPFRVDPDKVQARFTNGVLEVELQRPEAERPRKIEIKAD